MRTARKWAGAGLLGATAALAGCAHPAPAPTAELSLQPVADSGWQTFDAVLAGTFADPAASYDGIYPAKKKGTKFRIEVRVPRYAGMDTVGPSLIEPRPGQPPTRSPYLVVDVYTGSERLKVTPGRIVPVSPCGPPGTPPSAVSVGVHTETDGMVDQKLPAGSPFHVGYSRDLCPLRRRSRAARLLHARFHRCDRRRQGGDPAAAAGQRPEAAVFGGGQRGAAPRIALRTEGWMDADTLRALQAPLKSRYRELPESARIPARAEATLDMSDIACAVPVWHGSTTAGLHSAAGGSGELACSADMLLEALVACAGVTLRAVATAMGISIRGGRVVAEGYWDARGTLGVDKAAPVG